MILVDSNLLLYAKVSDYEQHEVAREWLDAQLNALPRVGLPWPSLLAFLRIGTNPRLFPNPMSPAVAWSQVTAWLALANVWIPLPTERHSDVLGDLFRSASPAGNLIPDNHLAAIAIEYGLTLCSTDGDFARFKGLSWSNPLQARR